VALGASVYMWSASSGAITQLMSTASEDDYITSLAWAADGKHISVGTYSSQVTKLTKLEQLAGRMFKPCPCCRRIAHVRAVLQLQDAFSVCGVKLFGSCGAQNRHLHAVARPVSVAHILACGSCMELRR
jgi:hypothetical protein